MFFNSITKKCPIIKAHCYKKIQKCVFFWCNVCDFLNLSIFVREYSTRSPGTSHSKERYVTKPQTSHNNMQKTRPQYLNLEIFLLSISFCISFCISLHYVLCIVHGQLNGRATFNTTREGTVLWTKLSSKLKDINGNKRCRKPKDKYYRVLIMACSNGFMIMEFTLATQSNCRGKI